MNKATIMIMAAFLLLIPLALANNSTEREVHYWRFNGDATDAGSIPVTLTLAGSALINTTTGGYKIGTGSLDLNISSTGYAYSTSAGKYNTDSKGGRTFAMWFYRNTIGPSAGSLMCLGDSNGYMYTALYNWASGADHNQTHWQTSGGGDATLNGNATMGTWSHLAIVYYNDTNKVVVYRNGVLIDNQTATDVGAITDAKMYVGAQSWTSIGTFFPGKIDDLRYYEYPLSPSNISLLYNGGSGCGEALVNCSPPLPVDTGVPVFLNYSVTSNVGGNNAPCNATFNNTCGLGTNMTTPTPFALSITVDRNASGVRICPLTNWSYLNMASNYQCINATGSGTVWSITYPANLLNVTSKVSFFLAANSSTANNYTTYYDGNNSFSLFINDLPPIITLYQPNLTNTSQSWQNYSWLATSATNGTLYCNVTRDSVVRAASVTTTNNTVTNSTTNTIPDGNHWWNVSCTNGVKTGYSANAQYWTDTTPPVMQSFTVVPANNSEWNASSIVFGSTWTDAANGFTTTTMVDSVQYSGNASVILAAGKHYYNFTGTDNVGNANTSTTYLYNLTKVYTFINVTILPSANTAYGNTATISCRNTTGASLLSLYQNGTLITTGVGNISTTQLTGGNYNYTCNASTNENFSGTTQESDLFIMPIPSAINLSLNPVLGIYSFQTLTASCTNSTGVFLMSLYQNGTLITTGTNNISTTITDGGNYNLSCNASTNKNFTGMAHTAYAHINPITTSINLTTNPVLGIYGFTTTISCRNTTGTSGLTLYRNGTSIATGVGNISTTQFSAGMYNFTCIANNDLNYTGTTQTAYSRITPAQTNINLSINPVSGAYGTTFTIACMNTTGTDMMSLYKNATLITTGVGNITTTQIVSGNYNYTCNTTSDLNFTGTTQTSYLHIVPITSINDTTNTSSGGQRYTEQHNITLVDTLYRTQKYGMNITINDTITIYNMTKHASCTATRAYVYDSNGNMLTNTSTHIGNVYQFTTPIVLTKGKNYYVVVDANGGTYNAYNHNSLMNKVYGSKITWNQGVMYSTTWRPIDPTCVVSIDEMSGAGSTYDPYATIQFSSVAGSDGIPFVVTFSLNSTNTTADCAGSTCSYNMTGLGAGTWNYNWTLTDDYGTIAHSVTNTYAITPATSVLTLTASPAQTGYMVNTNLTIDCTTSSTDVPYTLNLYKNNAFLISSTSTALETTIVLDTLGYINVSCTINATTNYTSSNSSLSLASWNATIISIVNAYDNAPLRTFSVVWNGTQYDTDLYGNNVTIPAPTGSTDNFTLLSTCYRDPTNDCATYGFINATFTNTLISTTPYAVNQSVITIRMIHATDGTIITNKLFNMTDLAYGNATINGTRTISLHPGTTYNWAFTNNDLATKTLTTTASYDETSNRDINYTYSLDTNYTIDNCSHLTINAVDIHIRNTNTSAAPVPHDKSTLDAYFEVHVDNEPQFTPFNLSWRGSDDYSICINSSQVLHVYAQMIYGNPAGFLSRTYYYSNTTLDNNTQDLTLWLDPAAGYATITVYDQTGTYLQGAFVHLLAYDIGTNSYTTDQVVMTGNDGKATINVEFYTKFYKVMIVYNGQAYTDNVPFVFATNTITRQINTAQNHFATLQAQQTQVSCLLEFHNDTRAWSFHFIDQTGHVVPACLITQYQSGISTTPFNQSCVSNQPSGDLLTTLPASTGRGTWLARGDVTLNGQTYTCIGTNTYTDDDRYKVWGNAGLIATFLIILTMALAGLWSPIAAILLAGVGLIVTVALGLFSLTWGIFLGVCIIGFMLMYKMQQK
jgi:hypothetical protein